MGLSLLGEAGEIEILAHLDMVRCEYDLLCDMLYSFALVLDTNRLLNTLADFEERDSSPIYAHRCAERVFALLIELSRSSQKAYNAISRCAAPRVLMIR